MSTILADRREATARLVGHASTLRQTPLMDEAKVLAVCALISWECRQIVSTLSYPPVQPANPSKK